MSEDIRELAFDTETTGLHHLEGDRVIEIGAVEMINHIPTGRTFRTLINPKRSVSEDTVRITGITDDDLRDAPFFEHPSVVDAFLEFLGDATLVAHNAGFDRNWKNADVHQSLNLAGSIRRRWPGKSIRARRQIWMRYVAGLKSRWKAGPFMARCWIANCWPVSTWSCLAGGRMPSRSRAKKNSPAVSANVPPGNGQCHWNL